MIYYGYEGGSKLTSYVTTRGVHNHPQRFVNRFRGVVRTAYVGTYEGGLYPPLKVTFGWGGSN